MIEEELLTTTETARILQITRLTLYKLRKAGEIETFYKGYNKKAIVFKKSDVLALQTKLNNLTKLEESK